MLICPRCDDRLSRSKTKEGHIWKCEICEGHMVNLAVLRKSIVKDFLKNLWAQTQTGNFETGLNCPSCNRQMKEIQIEVGSGLLYLDLCTNCQWIWFDQGEYEQSPQQEKAQPLDDESQKLIALAEIQLEQEAFSQREEVKGTVNHDGKFVWALFQLPVEENAPFRKNYPWATWILAAMISIVSCYGFFQESDFFMRWGMVPDKWSHHGGLGLLSSIFLHGGIFHLLVNIYFLLSFGDNVEDHLTIGPYLLLFFLSGLTANIFHLLDDPSSVIPCIGTSGAISGLIAYYALAFPKARIGILIWYRFYYRIPALYAFLLWLTMQIMNYLLYSSESVSYIAHLGGALIGFVFYLSKDVRPAFRWS